MNGGDFWSRRRAGVAAEEAGSARAAQDRATAADAAGLTDAELLVRHDLPDPDSLSPGDDFSAFMARAVPDHLRRRALRRLWGTNPVLANVDGLVDYGDDFTDAATVVENLQTAYRVGRGMLDHVRAQEAEEVAAPAEPDAEAAGDPQADDFEVTALSDSSGNDPQADGPVDRPDLPPEPQAQPRRRMQFAFDPQPAEDIA